MELGHHPERCCSQSCWLRFIVGLNHLKGTAGILENVTPFLVASFLNAGILLRQVAFEVLPTLFSVTGEAFCVFSSPRLSVLQLLPSFETYVLTCLNHLQTECKFV